MLTTFKKRSNEGSEGATCKKAGCQKAYKVQALLELIKKAIADRIFIKGKKLDERGPKMQRVARWRKYRKTDQVGKGKMKFVRREDVIDIYC